MSRHGSDEELRARLSRLDPAGAHVPVDPLSSPRAAVHLERAMQSLETPPVPAETRPATWRGTARRRGPLAAAIAAAAAAAATAGVLLTAGGEPTTLALALPPPDVAGSCLQFDVTFLAEMPVAFGGTVTAVGPDAVTLDVDRWYAGGDAERVRVQIPEQQTSAALDGVDFRTGERYLVTATNGTVNGCGYSGAATPDLARAFDTAFPG